MEPVDGEAGRKDKWPVIRLVLFRKEGPWRNKSLGSLEKENNGKCTGSIAETSKDWKKFQNFNLMLIFKGSVLEYRNSDHHYGVTAEWRGKIGTFQGEVPLSLFDVWVHQVL